MTEPILLIRPVLNALRLVAECGTRGNLTWLVGGSTATILHGVSLDAMPRDLDIDAPGESAQRLADQLVGYAVEPLQYSTTPLYSNFFGRYEVSGTKVEVIGDLVVKAQDWSHRFLITPWVYERCRRVEVDSGLQVRLVPLEHQLLVNLIRGREQRVARIAAHLRGRGGPDQEYLDCVYTQDQVPDELRQEVERLCRP